MLIFSLSTVLDWYNGFLITSILVPNDFPDKESCFKKPLGSAKLALSKVEETKKLFYQPVW